MKSATAGTARADLVIQVRRNKCIVLRLLRNAGKVRTTEKQLRGRPVVPSRLNEAVHNLRKILADQPAEHSFVIQKTQH